MSIGKGGGKTLREQRDTAQAAREATALRDPLVQAVLAAFPQGRIKRFRPPAETVTEVAEAALAEVEDEWDPFEDM